MPALKKPAKSKPSAPKKPSSKSKTGNSACSQAASNWQLSIRGKEALNPDTYATLAKCRAMSRTAKQANLHEASGKLSAQGRQALEGRLQKRFDQGLITQKSRDARLKELLAARKEKQSKTIIKNEPISIYEKREQSNRATLEPKNRFRNPIQGNTDSSLVGYQWISRIEEGRFRDRRVSDWGDAQTSVPTGRSIVHLFWVADKSGKETLMGRGAAEKALGWNKNQLLTTAKNEYEKQRTNQERYNSLSRNFKETKKEALHSIYNEIEKQSFYKTTPPVYMNEIDGKFVATLQGDYDGFLSGRGGRTYKMAPGRGSPGRDKLAEKLLAQRKARQPAPPAQPTPPAFSRQGQLAPGRGTEYRRRLARDILQARKDVASKRGKNRENAKIALNVRRQTAYADTWHSNNPNRLANSQNYKYY